MIQTERLILAPFTLSDAPFILRLVNEPSWIRFIGQRNVHTIEQAEAYLENGPLKNYRELGFGFWVVKDIVTHEPLGMCGITQRDYLDHPDLGFAFLPEHTGKGLALESATSAVTYARDVLHISALMAFCQVDNQRSIRLLEKLGFQYERVLKLENENLSLYRNDLANAGALGLS